MNKDIIKDIFSLKMKMIDSLSEHLPDFAKDRIHATQHSIITTISEVANEYLQKNKANEKKEDIKTVNIE